MRKLIKYEDELHESLKDPKFKKMYEKDKVLAGLAVKIAELRYAEGLTQKQLAGRLHTTQQMVSNWETCGTGNIEVKSLEKIAEVLNAKLKIDFIPRGHG